MGKISQTTKCLYLKNVLNIAILVFLAAILFKEPTKEPTNYSVKHIVQVMEERDGVDHNDGIVRRPLGLKALKSRNEIGTLLDEMGMETGVEVGVQRGLNSKMILSKWRNCKEYHLVDLWAHQQNYIDGANVNDRKQSKALKETKRNLEPWVSKTTYHKMLSTEAAKKFENKSLDFVYLDARHDYCGITEDIVAYWPLLRPGGVMAGHDYLTNAEQQKANRKSDWGLCLDGSRNEGAVRGAVEDFALKHGLVISVCYDEGNPWRSWLVQKPW